MKKTYHTPAAACRGDLVRETKATIGSPEPSGNGFVESVGSLGFNL
jgi:hypothetical protein